MGEISEKYKKEVYDFLEKRLKNDNMAILLFGEEYVSIFKPDTYELKNIPDHILFPLNIFLKLVSKDVGFFKKNVEEMKTNIELLNLLSGGCGLDDKNN